MTTLPVSMKIYFLTKTKMTKNVKILLGVLVLAVVVAVGVFATNPSLGKGLLYKGYRTYPATPTCSSGYVYSNSDYSRFVNAVKNNTMPSCEFSLRMASSNHAWSIVKSLTREKFAAITHEGKDAVALSARAGINSVSVGLYENMAVAEVFDETLATGTYYDTWAISIK